MNTLHLIKDCKQRMLVLQEAIPVKTHQFRIAEIDELMLASGIWNDNRKAATLLKERQSLSSLLERLKKISDDTALLFEYAESFPDEVDSLEKQVIDLNESISKFELSQMLNGPHDNGNAILTITSGAGGTEAKNFVMMLYRMYMRYADNMGWDIDVLDEKSSEEYGDICLDNISLQMNGENAYGFLKTESGVFRLIRNSPFNSADQRHTSFAAVSVIPDIEDKIDIVVNEGDLEWEVMRSSGSGGQSINTTESAVRVRHIPSGIAVRAQTEKSQHENRRIALKILKAKLYDIELKKRDAEKDKLMSNLSSVAFGNQIKTVVLQPYELVKDHRSGFESNRPDQFLDGNIQSFINAALRHSIKL